VLVCVDDYTVTRQWLAESDVRAALVDACINADFPAYAAGAFDRGMDAGYGTEDLAALIKVLRQGV
jgi:hypothetical protein